MISISKMEEMLDEIAEDIPKDFYTELNGGIILLAQAKKNKDHGTDDLYILGEYSRSGNLGRYISIYYGSFKKVYKNSSKKKIRKRLEKTLKHEFRHHLESLSGQRDLEIEDEQFIANYLRKRVTNA